jgi:hypothetical protein
MSNDDSRSANVMRLVFLKEGSFFNRGRCRHNILGYFAKESAGLAIEVLIARIMNPMLGSYWNEEWRV